MTSKPKISSKTNQTNIPKKRNNHASYLSSLFDNISDGLIATDLEFNIQEWNAAAEAMYGWTAAEVVGHPLVDFIQTAYTNTTREEAIQALTHNGIWKGEVTQSRKDGTWFPVMASVSMVKDKMNQPLGFVAVNRDITKRKQAEEQLRESEARLSAIFQVSPTSINIVSVSDDRSVDFNEAFLELVGYSREELLGHTAQELDLFVDREVRQTWMEQLVQGKTLRNQEAKIRRKTGEIRDVLLSLEMIDIKDEKIMVMMASDITERKRAEEKVERQNRRLKILREIDLGILAANSVEDIIGAALSHIRDLIDCRRANLTLIDSETNELVIFQVRTADETSIPSGSRLPIALFEDIIPTLSQNQPILFSDLLALADPMPGIQRLLKDGLRSTCSLPLFSQGNLIGMFSMHSEIPGFFDEEKINLGREVANQAAIAITQTRLVDALREQQARQRNILDGMLTFVVLISMDGIVLEVNRAALAAVGLKAEEVIGKPMTDLPFWSHSDGTHTRIHDAIHRASAGELVRADFPALLANGQVIMIDFLFNPLRDSAGNFVQVVGSGVDITERKKAEEAMRESEARYHRVLDTMMEGCQIIDFDWRYLYVNDAVAVGQARLKPEEMLNRTVMELYPGVEKTELFAALRQCMEGRVPANLETQFIFPDGRLGWFELGIHPVEEGIFILSSDITDRKQAEEKVQRQLKNLNALRMIDIAIASSFDLRTILDIVLQQVVLRLGVDASAVLLFDPQMRTLEFAASQGFRSSALHTTKLRLGEGYAGRVVLENRMIHIPNVMESGGKLSEALREANETFNDYYGVPLIVKGEIKGVLEIYQRSSENANEEWLEFFEMLAGQAAIAIDNVQLFNSLQRSNLELGLAYDSTIEGWSKAMDLRDKETEGHTQRVTDLTLKLANAMQINPDQLTNIRRGALLHDMGKLGVPDHILLKKDKLTPEEWDVMRQHPQFAYDMLSIIPYLKPALDIPYCHHEQWDGNGYPRGLKGDEIPLAARIFAVVDVWDALTSDRPYRQAWSREQALKHIQEQSGKHFDPQVVNAFRNLISD